MDSFEFIPSIYNSEDSVSENGHTYSTEVSIAPTNSGSIVEKKIVSYYLEEYLVERLKQVADENNMYYSTIVNHAIYLWLVSKGYE